MASPWPRLRPLRLQWLHRNSFRLRLKPLPMQRLRRPAPTQATHGRSAVDRSSSPYLRRAQLAKEEHSETMAASAAACDPTRRHPCRSSCLSPTPRVSRWQRPKDFASRARNARGLDALVIRRRCVRLAAVLNAATHAAEFNHDTPSWHHTAQAPNIRTATVPRKGLKNGSGARCCRL